MTQRKYKGAKNEMREFLTVRVNVEKILNEQNEVKRLILAGKTNEIIEVYKIYVLQKKRPFGKESTAAGRRTA